MAVPFGFSAGDFMAAIHLVHKVNIALRETDGASSQYNQTISELQGLEGLLRGVQSAYSADIDPQQLDKLQLLGHQCYIPLNTFLSKIKALEPSLGNLDTRSDCIIDRTRRTARKVHWGLQVKKELSELTAAMGLRINVINMQLLLINAERQEKAGTSPEALPQTLNGLNSQMESFQNSFDTRLNSLATTTSVDNVVQTLQDMRLEAANDRNAQMDNIRKQIDTYTGRFNPELSQQVLDSIELLNSKIEDHLARSRTNTTQDTAIPSPVSRPSIPADSGSSCQDQSAIQRVEVVDNDIESFAMVHIQSQNASARFWQPSGSRNLTVELALRGTIQRAAMPQQGSILMFWRKDFPQILKIGHTKSIGVEERLQTWSRSCKREYASDPQLYKETEMVVPFAYQVERLIHTELKNYRMRIECTGCSKPREEARAQAMESFPRMRNWETMGKLYHKEWFCVSKEHAFKVFQKWKAWMLLEPYVQTDHGEWVLKPSFLDHTSEICRPLTIED
ncbi:T5orf172 domain-containing protein [Alternaria rosae]|uniref:T5orf172 domain-containing protein n=1 Tax=Alternaria rosae TaxID=1187941 RepID=UPI001E8EDE9F|nr:T5orf172 domain-containing protein [Alternaria rosae]KAH6857418.1 T5orf172 domain-containing protein [Alternaria rosae]